MHEMDVLKIEFKLKKKNLNGRLNAMFTKYLFLSAINEKPQPLPYEQLVSLSKKMA